MNRRHLVNSILFLILVILVFQLIENNPTQYFEPKESYTSITHYQTNIDSKGVMLIIDSSGVIGKANLKDISIRHVIWCLSGYPSDPFFLISDSCPDEDLLLEGNSYLLLELRYFNGSSQVTHFFDSSSEFNLAIIEPDEINDFLQDYENLSSNISFQRENKLIKFLLILSLATIMVYNNRIFKKKKSQPQLFTSDDSPTSINPFRSTSTSIKHKHITKKYLDSISSQVLFCRMCNNKYRISIASCPKCNVGTPRCKICFNSFSPEDYSVYLPCCDSFVHSLEILEWIKKKNSCPVCRRDLRDFLLD